MPKKNFNVLIIGAGKIGAFFDTPKSASILTHAHAFSEHPGFKLIGFVDRDGRRANQAARIWGGTGFSNLQKAFQAKRVDVAVNATPDKLHYKILRDLMGRPLKFILTEKPLASSLTEANNIMKLARTKRIPIAVNYQRRFVPEFQALAKNIKNNKYGRYLAGTGYYGKGLKHNGSHLLDLVRYLIGEIKQIKETGRTNDYIPGDPSLSGLVTLKNGGRFWLQAINRKFYTIFEADLFFSRARLRIINSGSQIEIQLVKANPIFKGYKNISGSRIINTQLSRAPYFTTDNIHRYLTGREKKLVCSLTDGYEMVKISSVKNIPHL